MKMELGNPINRLTFIAENASEREQLTALTMRLNTQYIRLNYQHKDWLHLILDTPSEIETMCSSCRFEAEIQRLKASLKLLSDADLRLVNSLIERISEQ